jgi:hypothetical protein
MNESSKEQSIKLRALNEVDEEISVEQALDEVKICKENDSIPPTFRCPNEPGRFLVARREVKRGTHSELINRQAHFAYAPDEKQATTQFSKMRKFQSELEEVLHNNFHIEPLYGAYRFVVPFDCGIGINKQISPKKVIGVPYGYNTAIIDYVIRPHSQQSKDILVGQYTHKVNPRKNPELDIGEPHYKIGATIIKNPLYCPVFHPQLIRTSTDSSTTRITVGTWMDQIALSALNYQFTLFGVEKPHTKELAFQTILVDPDSRTEQIITLRDAENNNQAYRIKKVQYRVEHISKPFTRMTFEDVLSARGYHSPELKDTNEPPIPFTFTRIVSRE